MVIVLSCNFKERRNQLLFAQQVFGQFYNNYQCVKIFLCVCFTHLTLFFNEIASSIWHHDSNQRPLSCKSLLTTKPNSQYVYHLLITENYKLYPIVFQLLIRNPTHILSIQISYYDSTWVAGTPVKSVSALNEIRPTASKF